MKGKYTTLTGETVTVDSFDAENKILSIHLGSGQYRWVHEGVYSKWVSNDTSKVVELVEVPKVEPVVEKPKTRTKKVK